MQSGIFSVRIPAKFARNVVKHAEGSAWSYNEQDGRIKKAPLAYRPGHRRLSRLSGIRRRDVNVKSGFQNYGRAIFLPMFLKEAQP